MHPTISQAVAFFIFMEMAFPRSLMVSLSRVASILALGTWFLAIAHIMHANPSNQPRLPRWQSTEPIDMTPVMFLPVVFSWNITCACLAVLAAYCGAKILHDRCDKAYSPLNKRFHAGLQ